MKKSLVLSLVLVSALFGSLGHAKEIAKVVDDVERVASDKSLCKDGACKKITKKDRRKGSKSTCSCYCSVLCSPREIQKQDKPRFVDKEEAKELGIPSQCYCQQSDIDDHVQNCLQGQAEEAAE